ncbi:MAG: hypothetical protein PHT76_12105 [Anaerostipes sp.]|nr:hypothetical protein [Anaerostipes sp.]MDD4433533.1 hypothetical protein [Parabacteroides sp.]
MAKYIVEDIKTNSYEKNYKIPLINIVPAVVWSIPFHQKLFPDASWWMTFGICAAFVVLYCALSYMPFISAVPCIAGVIIFTALFWVFADYIGNDIARIVVKVVIAAFFGFVELALFANATIPWLDRKNPKTPRVRRIEE